MNRKNFAIRALVMLLCVTMLIGMVPITMSAETGDPVRLIEGKDIVLGGPADIQSFISTSYDPMTGVKTLTTTAAIAGGNRSDGKYITIGLGGQNAKAAPYVALGIAINGSSAGSRDTSVELGGYGSGGNRFWGMVLPYPATLQNYVIDMTKCKSGGGNVPQGWSNVTDTHTYNVVRIRIVEKDQTIPAGATVEVKYVAFFANEADAKAYTYEYKLPAKIEFLKDDGSVFETVYDETAGAGKVVLPETNPTVTGKKFTGWALADGTPVTADTNVADICAQGASVKVYPQYVDAYTIELVVDGETFKTLEVVDGNKIGELPEAPVRKGYTFDGWEDEAGNVLTAETVPTANAVYTAKYTAIEEAVKVVYMLDETNVFKLFNTNTDETLPTPETDPTRVGYTFKNWDVAKADGVVEAEYVEGAIIGTYLADGKDTITVKPVFTKNPVFGEEEEPEVSSYYLYTADNSSIASANQGVYSGAVVNEDGKSYIRYTTAVKASLGDNDRLIVKFDGTPLTNVPVMKMCYRTNTTRTSVETNLYVGGSRLWGASIPGISGDGEWQTVTVDLSKGKWNGGDGSFKNWASLEGKDVTGFLLRPFAAGTTENYFDIAYVAFFATEDEANAFEYTGVATMNINGKTVVVVAGQEYTLPEAPVVPNKNFDNYTDEAGNQYKAGDKITAKDGLKLTANYVDASSFTIKYYDADGTLLTTVEKYPLNTAINHADYVTVNAPAGQEFSGWFYEGTYWEIEDGYVVDRDMTLVATYDATDRYVTYKVDGEIYGAQTYKKGAGIELADAPDKGTDYYFIGWKNSANKAVVFEGDKVTENLVLYADYAKFDINKNEGAITVLIGILKKLEAKKTGTEGGSTVAGEAPVLVLGSDLLAGSKGAGGVEAAAAEENGKSYIRFNVPAETVMTDGTRVYTLFDTAAVGDFKITDAPIVAIGYRTNSASANLDFNPMFVNEEGKNARLWGSKPKQNNGSWQKIVIDVNAQNWNGGEGVSGEDAASRLASVSGMVPSGFCLKPFGDNGTTIKAGSYYDVEYIAFFKTKEDANAYVYGAESTDSTNASEETKEETKEENKTESSATSAAVFTADQLVTATKAANNQLTVTEGVVEADGTKYVQVKAAEDGASVDNTCFKVILSDLGANFSVKKNPYCVVKYKSNIKASVAIDFNMRTSYQGSVKRIWGAKVKYKNDNKQNKVVINLSEVFNGGEVSDYAWANVDADATANELWFKPWGGAGLGGTLTTSDYFMIEEIAFFASADAANAY